MRTTWTFNSAGQLVFGSGAAAQLGQLVRDLGARRVLIVTDRNLLAAGQPVRAVVRDFAKGEAWAKRGCDLAGADIHDAAALTAAFQGSEGVFVLVPPIFDPSSDFREARTTAGILNSALEAARPARVVYLLC